MRFIPIKAIATGILGGNLRYLLQDNFTAADTTTLDSRAPSPVNKIGGAWSVLVGTWTISSNKAICSTISSGAFNYVVYDTTRPDFSLSVDVTVPASGSFAPGFVLRYVDNTHHYFAIYIKDGGTSQLQIRQRNGGAVTTVATLNVAAVTAGSTIALMASAQGDTISITLGGDTLSFSSALMDTATKHGLAEYRDGSYGSNKYDGFVMDNLAITYVPVTSLQSSPIAIEQHGFEECAGLLYVVGGANAVTALDTVYAYNPATNTWAQKADLPIAVQSPMVRSVGGKLYCIGGQGVAPTYTKYPDTYEYDPDTNAWTKMADMPTAREDAASCVIDGKIYVFGGLTNGAGLTPVKVLEIYDPGTNTWDATKADMPDFKHFGDPGAAYDGKAYAVGASNSVAGYESLTPSNTVYVYDPVGDSWDTKAVMPGPRCYKEVAVVGGKMYVGSGATRSTTNYTDTFYAYDFGTDTWSFIGRLPYAARGMALAEYNGSIYISGGFNVSFRDVLYRITPV